MESNRRTWLIAVVLAIMFGPLWVACGPTPPPRTGGPTETSQVDVAPTVPTPIAVTMMVADTGDEVDVLTAQIDSFNMQNPDIYVELDTVPPQDLYNRLVIAQAAGTSPDVTVLSRNDVALLQRQGILRSLDQWVPTEQFVPDAVDSNRFNDQLYGLPWWRSACLPHYRSLALFAASSHPAEAYELMDFLTQPTQQEQNFAQVQWFPTRLSVYDPLGLAWCLESPVQAIRLAPEDVGTAISLTQHIVPSLAPVLEGQTINTAGAVAVIENGEVQGTGAPVMDPISAEEMQARLDTGVVVGMLSVENAPEYPPGDYAVKWQRVDGVVLAYLVPLDGEPLEVPLESFDTVVPVGLPFCEVLSGSHKWCPCLDGLCGCIRVG